LGGALGWGLSVKQVKKRPAKLFYNDAFYEELLKRNVEGA